MSGNQAGTNLQFPPLIPRKCSMYLYLFLFLVLVLFLGRVEAETSETTTLSGRGGLGGSAVDLLNFGMILELVICWVESIGFNLRFRSYLLVAARRYTHLANVISARHPPPFLWPPPLPAEIGNSFRNSETANDAERRCERKRVATASRTQKGVAGRAGRRWWRWRRTRAHGPEYLIWWCSAVSSPSKPSRTSGGIDLWEAKVYSRRLPRVLLLSPSTPAARAPCSLSHTHRRRPASGRRTHTGWNRKFCNKK